MSGCKDIAIKKNLSLWHKLTFRFKAKPAGFPRSKASIVYIGIFTHIYISIYKFGLSVWVSVCLFVSNKRQNSWTDRAQIFCGTSRDHREGLWMIKISNICLHQNSIFIKFLKILKIHEIFCVNPRIIFVLFYDVHKENMFTINLEDGRSKASFTILIKNLNCKLPV